MSSDVTSDIPPTPPKASGRKKIKIQRIEDSRNRQVTFLKRKNGLLKKAMELGILCDCEVTVIIFNLNNGKLFEYSSVEPETVLQKYATYSGPSERRRKEKFFELSASKGTSNIPVNEPQVARAAMDAATAAARRPRPFQKFKNSENEVGEDVYYNGRKLSSGESPGNSSVPRERSGLVPAMGQLLPATAMTPSSLSQMNSQHLSRCSAADQFARMQMLSPMLDGTPLTAQISNPKQISTNQQPSAIHQYPMQTFPQSVVARQNALQPQNRGQREERSHHNLQGQPQSSPSITNTAQTIGVDLPSTKSLNTVFTPRFAAELSAPPLFTPNSAGRQLSAILGLPTPTTVPPSASKRPFALQSTATERIGHETPLSTPRVMEPERMVNTDALGPVPGSQSPKRTNPDSESQINGRQFANSQLTVTREGESVDSKPNDSPMSYTRDSEMAGSTREAASKNALNEAENDDCVLRASSGSNERITARGSTRTKPNLRVVIPNSNRDDLTAITSSGLFSATVPTNGIDFLPGLGPTLGSSRLPSMSPAGYGIWPPGWHPLGSGDRDVFPVPLTPFLNENLDSFRNGQDSEFGAGHPLSLPSPTNAGLFSLTPRHLGFDPLLSTRGDPSSAMPSKRTFEQAFENGAPSSGQK